MFKRDFVVATDPDTGVETALYNPRTQHWKDHFRWDDDKTGLVGLSAVGRATVSRLRINRARCSSRATALGGSGLTPATGLTPLHPVRCPLGNIPSHAISSHLNWRCDCGGA